MSRFAALDQQYPGQLTGFRILTNHAVDPRSALHLVRSSPSRRGPLQEAWNALERTVGSYFTEDQAVLLDRLQIVDDFPQPALIAPWLRSRIERAPGFETRDALLLDRATAALVEEMERAARADTRTPLSDYVHTEDPHAAREQAVIAAKTFDAARVRDIIGRAVRDAVDPPMAEDSQIEHDYRAAIVNRGSYLPLVALDPALRPIQMAAADCDVRVAPHGSDAIHGRALKLALRRHGRLLLVGRGGSGKSTLVRELAANLAEKTMMTAGSRCSYGRLISRTTLPE